MKKMILSMMLMMCFCCIMVYGQETAVVSSGAMMWVYNYNEKGMPNPEDDPLEVVKDNADVFAWDNLSKYGETSTHSRKLRIIVWEGFLNIPADGSYTFSGKVNDNSAAVINVLIMDKKLITVGSGRHAHFASAASKSLNLKAGDYPIKIALAQYDVGYQAAYLDFKFWNKKTPLNKNIIAPSKLVCKTQQ